MHIGHFTTAKWQWEPLHSKVGLTQPHSGNDQGRRIRGMIKAAVALLGSMPPCNPFSYLRQQNRQ